MRDLPVDSGEYGCVKRIYKIGFFGCTINNQRGLCVCTINKHIGFFGCTINNRTGLCVCTINKHIGFFGCTINNQTGLCVCTINKHIGFGGGTKNNYLGFAGCTTNNHMTRNILLNFDAGKETSKVALRKSKKNTKINKVKFMFNMHVCRVVNVAMPWHVLVVLLFYAGIKNGPCLT